MVMITLYVRQQKKHRCIELSFGLCGRGRGWDDLGERCLACRCRWAVNRGQAVETGSLLGGPRLNDFREKLVTRPVGCKITGLFTWQYLGGAGLSPPE